MLKPGDHLTEELIIQELIGEGAFGCVYKAFHARMKRVIAVKELMRGQAKGDATRFERYAAQFAHEVQALSKFNDANIVQVYDIIERADASYLLMEYVEGMAGIEGKSLKDLLNQLGPLALEQSLLIGKDVLKGLAAIHADGRDVVHRDLKPSNILLTRQGRAKITDFGLAQLSDESLRSGSGTPHPGTPAYMSPEQASTTDYLYPSSDIFSFGCVAFEMLSGKGYKKARSEQQGLSDLRQDLPAWLVALLGQMLLVDPEKRPANGSKALKLWQDGIDEEIEKLHRKGLAAGGGRIAIGEVLQQLEALGEEGQRAAAKLREERQVKIEAEQKESERMVEAIHMAIAQERWEDAQALLKDLESAGTVRSLKLLGLSRELKEKQEASRQRLQRQAEEQAAQEKAYQEERRKKREAALRWWLFGLAGLVLLALLCLGGYFGWKYLRADLQAREFAARTAIARATTEAGTLTVVAQTAHSAQATEVLTARLQTAEAETLTPAPSATPDPKILPACYEAVQLWNSPVDNMTLVCVPAGEFGMGQDEGKSDEKPRHTVYLDAYWIDQVEVTNAMFQRFVTASGYQTRAEQGSVCLVYNNGWNWVGGAGWSHPTGSQSSIEGLENYPVVNVTWEDAKAYCDWAGRQLPTEAQWEKAARGTDGRIFPWGNQEPDCQLANSYNMAASRWCVENTSPVYDFPAGASPYGALGMVGNAWEWVNDWYQPGYYTLSPVRNPPGPAGEYKILRGGSWYHDSNIIRTYYRQTQSGAVCASDVGFRCAVASP